MGQNIFTIASRMEKGEITSEQAKQALWDLFSGHQEDQFCCGVWSRGEGDKCASQCGGCADKEARGVFKELPMTETEKIQERFERGYTMAVYGTREEVYKQMWDDIRILLCENKALSINATTRVKFCKDCNVEFKYDWHHDYDTCPECGNDKPLMR
jgi:hypothetical protein